MFWIPKTKKDLVTWLNNRFKCAKFDNMKTKQLYAIYYKERVKNG